jgi:hypothetical protein
LLVEGYGDGGGGCAGATSCGCSGSSGRAWVAPVGVCGCGAGTCGRAAGARVGQLGLGRFVSDGWYWPGWWRLTEAAPQEAGMTLARAL